jgi:ribose transport system ATP-binding protein
MSNLPDSENGQGVPTLQLSGVSKNYGKTQALAGVDLAIGPGEVIGLVGHNGAGKSTLMRVICGQTVPDTGDASIGGHPVPSGAPLTEARALGIQIAFQELSLAPTLRVFENTLVARPALAGWGWRKKAQTAIIDVLDEIFPGHGVKPTDVVESLPLARRQMIEIAQTAIPDRAPLSLLILDEPTSALGHEQAENLFAHIRKLSSRGVSTILISHKMGEILQNTTRSVIMRDGHIVEERPTRELDADSIVAVMSAESVAEVKKPNRRTVAPDARPLLTVTDLHANRLHEIDVSLLEGEIVGISGLDGQGQQELLQALYHARRGTRAVQVAGKVSFVTGDRQRAGIFPLWSTGENIGIGVAAEYSRAGVVDRKREQSAVADWMTRLAVRGRSDSPIVDLSGGNQQKALIARALATSANVVLLDDPFRGVDIDTRRLLYTRMREEADKGRSFLWFTTENAELSECDRVLVMSEGRIVRELVGEEITEENVISASFVVKE